jgi:hypothetical protein
MPETDPFPVAFVNIARGFALVPQSSLDKHSAKIPRGSNRGIIGLENTQIRI